MTIRSNRSPFILAWLLLLAFLQVSPVSAQGASAASANLPTIAFAETRFDKNREGYLALSWNSIEDAVEYVVTENVDGRKGSSPYRGSFEQAFVSGLSDGTYSFDVRALDAAGNVIAQSREPAVVIVLHWPLWQALTLFSIGLTVFLILIGIIARGAFATATIPRRVDEGEAT